jgi:hypothetical protein
MEVWRSINEKYFHLHQKILQFPFLFTLADIVVGVVGEIQPDAPGRVCRHS